MLLCEKCQGDDLDKVETLPDERFRVLCNACGHTWLHGIAKVPKPLSSFAGARRQFPGPDAVEPERRARVEALKAEFLRAHPEPQPAVEAYWSRYQQIFSAEGLRECAPQDLKDFANDETGANPGNMSVFNTAWKALGEGKAADDTRAAIEYLLRGPDYIPLEDRLTDLIEGKRGLGMKGFREALLTKVLCVTQPNFIPILIYSSTSGGKKEIAKLVWDLDFPTAKAVHWTIGRLILWSNDVLGELAGDGFAHRQHVAQFLWTTKDRAAELARA